MRPALRVLLPAPFGLLLLLAASGEGVRDDREDPLASEWASPDEEVRGEPAATLDAAGHEWLATLHFRGTSEVGARVDVVLERLQGAPLRGPLAEAEALPALPTIAPLADGVYVVWERGPTGARELVGRAASPTEAGLELGEVETIATGRVLAPHLAPGPDGRLDLVWVDAAGLVRRVRHATRGADGWGEAQDLAPDAGDAFAPRCAAGPDGALHVVYDAWDGASYDVHHVRLRDGEVVARHVVDGGPGHASDADVTVAPDGAAWIAWERAEGFGRGGALRSQRTLGLARLEGDALERHDGFLDPAAATWRGVHGPRVAWAGAGPVVAWHAPEMRREKLNVLTNWHLMTLRVDADGAADVRPVEDVPAEPSPSVALLARADVVDLLFPAQRREHYGKVPVWTRVEEGDRRVARAVLGTSAAAPRAAPEEAPTPAPVELAPLPTDVLYGDLHRHTNVSRCNSMRDGTFLDQIRYARGPGALAFLAVTDHVQHLSRYGMWRTARDAERHDVPGRLAVFPAVERVEIGDGHENLVWRAADELLAHVGVHVPSFSWVPDPTEDRIAIPHMMGTKSNGFDWRGFDQGDHRVFYVFQGLRGSYEVPGLPYRADDFEADRFSVAEGLRTKRRFGFVAASDHTSTGAAFAAVRADAIDRDAIFAELRARRTFATSSRADVSIALGELVGGEGGPVPQGAPLRVAARGAAPVASVEVMKNGAAWRAFRGEGDEELFVVSCSTHQPFADPRALVQVEGAEVLAATPRPPAQEELRAETAEGRVLVWGGGRRADVVIRARPRDDGARVALVHRAHTTALELAAHPPGAIQRTVFGGGCDEVWRVGAPLGEPEVALEVEDPGRRRGDSYYARIVFEDGSIAWTSPIWVGRIERTDR